MSFPAFPNPEYPPWDEFEGLVVWVRGLRGATVSRPMESMHRVQASTVALPILTLRIAVFSAPHNSQFDIASPIGVDADTNEPCDRAFSSVGFDYFE